MKHIPEELFDYLISVSDEAALVVLSCTSWYWRERVSSRQAWWRWRFAQQFSLQDARERKWLRLHVRARRVTACNGNHSSRLYRGAQLDWFTTYCMRRAAEYRWRRGQHTKHQLAAFANTHPRGIHLQSILIVPQASPAESAAVASQWLPAPQQQPVWSLEQLCWDGVEAKHTKIVEAWQGEYLVLGTRCNKHGTSVVSVYVWHFAALHRPPRVIVDSLFVASLNVYENWLVCQQAPSEDSEPPTVCVHDLARNQHYSEVLGTLGNCCIVSSTNDSIDFIQLQHSEVRLDSIVVMYKLWQVALDHAAAPFKYRAAGKRQMFRSGSAPVEARRIDDSKILLWTPCEDEEDEYDEPDPMETPSLVLLQISSDALNVSLEEKWSSDVKAAKVWPIISRNMLCVDHKDATQTLLNLADGSVVHRVLLRCWYYSGLYPLESQWQSMAEDTEWDDPLKSMPGRTIFRISPSALAYNEAGRSTIIDYTGYSCRSNQKSPLAIEQQLSRYINIDRLTTKQRLMLTRVFT